MAYRIELTTEIAAAPERVWRALTDPDEVVRWDATVVGALDAPPDYPLPGQHVRWRCRGTTELLHDRPQDVEPSRRLHSLLEFGRQRMDEHYTLAGNARGAKSSGGTTDLGTILSLHIALKLRAPFVAGPILLHLIDGPATRRSAEASMTNLKYYCELAPR